MEKRIGKESEFEIRSLYKKRSNRKERILWEMECNKRKEEV